MESRSLSKVATFSAAQYIFPAERNSHVGTMMAWPTKLSVDKFDIDATRKEVASIATAISRYEPLHLFTLKNPENVDSARALLEANNNVFIHPIAKLDSLWARDTGPLFIQSKEDETTVSGLMLNFNNWGNKFAATGDSKTASSVLKELNVQAMKADFVAEGGALEFDGQGTLMTTESSILNSNRNPGKSKADIEAEFARAFGITKIIWLKGVKGYDLTDCHIDALARFVSPGLVVLTRPSSSHPQAEKDVYEDAKTRLEKETDAKGRKMRVVELPEPEYAQFEGETVCSYVNYYVADGAIIAPRFGDENADMEAQRILECLFPERVIEQVLLKQLPLQGGGIHCATQQILA
jgi:agmatine deiminase